MEISSKENPVYKELKKIAQEKSDFIFVEGKKLFLESLSSNLKVEKVFISKENHAFIQDVLKNNSCEITYVTNHLLSSLFTTDSKPTSSDLIIALVKKPNWKLTDLLNTRKNLIFLEAVQDPGNLGAIIRSALAFKAGGIILPEGSVYPFNTKVIRASAGAVFKLPIIVSSVKELKEKTSKEGYKLIAFSSKSKKPFSQINNDKPFVLFFGNEGKGLTDEIVALVDDVVSIPHSDKVESLNVGVAASLVLWELYKNG